MQEDDIESISQWVGEYWYGYQNYMMKHHGEIFVKFFGNIHPPQKIGGCIGIMQGAIHSDEDYNEIMKITKEFCEKYRNPVNFPKVF